MQGVNSDESAARDLPEDLEAARRVLQDHAATIDEMWREAHASAEFSEWAIALGDASLSMHRALIALESPHQGSSSESG